MPGTFNKATPPKRPGAYFNFQARTPEPTFVSSVGVVALVATHSWGPSNAVTVLNSYSDFLAQFTQGGTTPPAYTAGYRAVRDTFKGEGLVGTAGAGQVLFYRVAGSSAAAAAHSFSNGTVPAITLTGKYKGTFGNSITVTIVANTIDPTNTADLVILAGGFEVERFSYAKTNITDLAAQINGTTPYTALTASDYVVASAVTSGVALTAVSAVALTGGDDGTTLTPTDYSNAQTAFEPYRFGVMTIDNLTDSTALTALVTWARNLNSRGKRFETVVGGAAAESMATAVARSATINDPNFVNVGSGTYIDADYGSISTAQLTPRLAGIIAARGVNSEITFARLAGLSISIGSTDNDILSAIGGGVVAIARDSHPIAPVRFELGVTTFTTATDTSRPLNIYSQIKFVRTMQDIETELTSWAEQNVIGRLQVNDHTRDFVRGHMQASMAAREAAGVIQPGWSVTTDTNPPPTPQDTFIALLYSITFGRGLQQILNTVVVG